MADRMDASIQEIVALEARLIHRIAKLRAAVETVHDAMAHLNALRSFCEGVLAADHETRCAVAPGAVRKRPEQYSVRSKSRRLLPISWH